MAKRVSTPSNPATDEQVARVREIQTLAKALVLLADATSQIPLAEVDSTVKKIAALCRKHEASKWPSLGYCPDCGDPPSSHPRLNQGGDLHRIPSLDRCIGNRNMCTCTRRF